MAIMSNLHHLLIVFLLAPALMCRIADSMLFEVRSSHPKCISEDMKANVISAGNYHVVNHNNVGTVPDDHKISVRVRPSSRFNLLFRFYYYNSRILILVIKKMFEKHDSHWLCITWFVGRCVRLMDTVITMGIMCFLVILHLLQLSLVITPLVFRCKRRPWILLPLILFGKLGLLPRTGTMLQRKARLM